MNKLISNNKNLFRKLENFDHSLRTLPKNQDLIKFNGKKLINFASNDYLGFSKDREIIKTSIKWITKYGSSLSSSRLITGNLDKIRMIEEIISKKIKHESSIILGNGFLLNSTLIPALTGNSLGNRKKYYIFSDKLNHASINYGCFLSRQDFFRYNHLDLNHLESQLKKIPINSQKIIISETLFSMDGDFVDIDGIRFLSKKYKSILYLDEAHAIGVYGKNGFGLFSNYKKNINEIVVGTFSKSLGSYGSFVSCSKHFYKIIVNNCGGLIYSTVLPPSVLGSIFAAITKVDKVTNLRNKIKDNYEYIIKSLKKIGLDTGNSNSQIIPIILKNHQKCKMLYRHLLVKGFYVKEVRPPTVPRGLERIRLSITATMTKSILKKFINTISAFKFK